MKKIILLTLGAVLLTISCGDNIEDVPGKKPGSGDTPSEETTDYSERAKEIHDRILNYYTISYDNYVGLLHESIPRQAGDPDASFLWSYDGWVSGVTLLHKLGYDVDYVTTVGNFQKYYTTGSSVNPSIGAYGPGTNGSVNGGNGDRYYDDNSIVGINMVDAYKLTNDPSYLVNCKNIVTFLKSGKDNHLGGAMWWRENSKNPLAGDDNSNKPACSNGYGTCFLLDYYTVCPAVEKTEVLAFAKELYDWLYNNLRDISDNCYYNAKQAQGTVQTYKWTYNSGVMIQNGIRLYEITGEQKYLDHAIATANGSYDYFVKTANGIMAYPDHDQWFNTKLFIAYLDLIPYLPAAENYVKTYIKYIDYAYKNSRNTSGLFYEGWSNQDPGRSHWLLIQAATLESYGAIALYEQQ